MSDEPAPTRWSFQFGRKKVPEPQQNGQSTDGAVSNGSSSGVTANGNGHVKRTADLAIYEQFQNQGRSLATHSNGVLSDRHDEIPQKSLLPAFESAEMRSLGESLCRDIVRGSPDVKWESIKGLENAKRLLKEAVVMPIKYPKYVWLMSTSCTYFIHSYRCLFLHFYGTPLFFVRKVSKNKIAALLVVY
ncbi:hypothetical protein ACFX2I_036369 [Malus domestica]